MRVWKEQGPWARTSSPAGAVGACGWRGRRAETPYRPPESPVGGTARSKHPGRGGFPACAHHWVLLALGSSDSSDLAQETCPGQDEAGGRDLFAWQSGCGEGGAKVKRPPQAGGGVVSPTVRETAAGRPSSQPTPISRGALGQDVGVCGGTWEASWEGRGQRRLPAMGPPEAATGPGPWGSCFLPPDEIPRVSGVGMGSGTSHGISGRLAGGRLPLGQTPLPIQGQVLAA